MVAWLCERVTHVFKRDEWQIMYTMQIWRCCRGSSIGVKKWSCTLHSVACCPEIEIAFLQVSIQAACYTNNTETKVYSEAWRLVRTRSWLRSLASTSAIVRIC